MNPHETSYTYTILYYTIYQPGTPKNHIFFLVIRLRLFFLVITAMHFVQANVAILVYIIYIYKSFWPFSSGMSMAYTCDTVKSCKLRNSKPPCKLQKISLMDDEILHQLLHISPHSTQALTIFRFTHRIHGTGIFTYMKTI